MALLFVTLPFVVRSVQPVLIELDREVEEAAASLGASNATTFRRIVLPALRPAIFSGAALAFARAVGEFGSLRADRGQGPDREHRDLRRHRERRAAGGGLALGRAAALSLVILVAPAPAGGPRCALAARHAVAARGRAASTWRCCCCCRSAWCSCRTFEHGFGAAWGWMTTPAAVSAFWLTVAVAAIAVPLNTIFGVGCALVLVRGAARGARGSRRADRPAVRRLAGDRRASR